MKAAIYVGVSSAEQVDGTVICSVCKRPFTASLSSRKAGGKHGYYRCTGPGHLSVEV